MVSAKSAVPGLLLVSSIPVVPPPPNEYPPTVPVKFIKFAPTAVVNEVGQSARLAAVLLLQVTLDPPTVMVMKDDASACGTDSNAAPIPTASPINTCLISTNSPFKKFVSFDGQCAQIVKSKSKTNQRQTQLRSDRAENQTGDWSTNRNALL